MRKLWFVLLLFPMFAWAQSPFDGTWKMDVNTAQFPEKPQITVLQNGTYQSPTSVPKINVKADGTDQPVPEAKDYDTLAVKVVDDKTVEITNKKGGRVIASSKGTVSGDGKAQIIEFIEYPMSSKEPVKGKIALVRVAPGPSGSHAISGSWRMQKVMEVSENALMTTIKCSKDGMTYSTTTGESFEGKFDGRDYPITGAGAGYTVALKKLNDRSIESTVKRDGKIVEVSEMTIAPDGKTASIKVENKVQGTTTKLTATKQ